MFVSNSDNLGAVPDAQVAGWFKTCGAPFAIEAVRRTASDRKGGHFARRKSDGRIVLRETAQTLPGDREALADLDRHRFARPTTCGSTSSRCARSSTAAAASSACR